MTSNRTVNTGQELPTRMKESLIDARVVTLAKVGTPGNQ